MYLENNIKVFGLEHLSYVIISTIILVIVGIILKLKIKDEKSINIMFHIFGLIGFIVIIICRIATCFQHNNVLYMIPDSFCALASLITSIGLLFLKKDNILLHGTWLIVIAGGILATLMPDYLNDGPTIFYLPTFLTLIHHSLSLFFIIMAFIYKYIRLSIKKIWIQPVMISLCIALGYLVIALYNSPYAFYINKPAIDGTILYAPLLYTIYFIVYLIIILIVELYRKHKLKTE